MQQICLEILPLVFNVERIPNSSEYKENTRILRNILLVILNNDDSEKIQTIIDSDN